MKITNMTLEEKISQMLVFDMTTEIPLSKVEDIIKKYKIGGLLLFKRNYSNYDEMINLVNKLKRANQDNKIPLFISLDQEGGRVNRIPNDFHNLKSTFSFAKTEDISLIKETANITAEILYKSGINMNFAPCLDVKRFSNYHAIGDRCYGENVDDVIKYGLPVVKEYEKNKVIPVLKHFPGHGATKGDSHFEFPKIKKDLKALEEEDTKVYMEAIKKDCDAIMVSHTIIKDLDSKVPASLSEKVVKDYLIKKLKFRGLIVTDNIKMGAIRFKYPTKRAILKAINAGNNLILAGNQLKNTEKIISYIVKKVKDGIIKEENIDNSVNKIVALKQKYKINDRLVNGINNIDSYNKKIDKLNSLSYNLDNEGEKNMKAKVYYTKNITPENLIKIYEKLGVELTGKVGVKVSTGEKGSRGYLKAELISPLVKKLKGTIIECNTAYSGERNTYEDHIKVAEEHGFTSFSNVDIMDKDGEIKIPVHNGKHLKYDIIGENFKNYDSILNLAHGKGHAMGGFGGNLKNQSIGIASRNGKAYIHSCGQTEDPNKCWSCEYEQKDFIESMAEAAKAVSDYIKEENKKIVYITVMNFLSVDCDCDKNQTDPVMEDLGIVASLDPVANDQAFIDMIWNSSDPGKEKLKERIDTREGRHILEYAEEIGLGTREYELINID